MTYVLTLQATGAAACSKEKLITSSPRGSDYTGTSRSTKSALAETSSHHLQEGGAIPVDVEKRIPKLYKNSKLAPLDLTFNNVTEKDYTVSLKGAHKKALETQVHNASTQAQASVLFVVKRPGCILCHEQGFDLKGLIDEFPAQSVGAFACIKEINVDNEGLLALYQNYFRFPFYRDTNLNVYKTLGDRKVNIFTALRRYYSAKARWESKGLKGNMIGKGEGLLLGGVMIFYRKGELQYSYKEKFGLELPLNEIRMTIQGIMNN